MPGKVYAVRKGRTTGIFTNWEDCRKQVEGYSGAEFKSFPTFEEAGRFLTGDTEQVLPEKNEMENDPDTVVAYVDGSYSGSETDFSYGMVILDEGKELTFYGRISDAALAKMHNVAGEIAGAREAMQYAVLHHKKKLILYHDYEGIAKWCLGEWKTNKEETKAYREFYEKVCESVKVVFVKVKGHSGDRYNDLADKLAKYALEAPENC